METQHLNLSRQLAKHCQQVLKIPSLSAEYRAVHGNVLDLHGASTKFLLPEGGRLFDDFEFRALDETQVLRLPYKYICLEYRVIGGRAIGEPAAHLNGIPQYDAANAVSAPKRVVFARERESDIVVTTAFCTQHDGQWNVMPELVIPNTGFLDRTKITNGRVCICFQAANESIPFSDYADELGALLCFLNVLQCSNVHIERSAPTKKPKKKAKLALPFDAYHILTVNVDSQSAQQPTYGTHRSPREHLRRGHIRRMSDGRRLWINATVVGAGRGAGVITKDYAIGSSVIHP